jgi:hypothetical protein
VQIIFCKVFKSLALAISSLFSGFLKIKSIVSNLSNVLVRSTSIDYIENGLKLSSRTDTDEFGVVLNTDNLTADRVRNEQDKDGTYALVEDLEDLTLEQVRQNGNLVEGDIVMSDAVSILPIEDGGGYYLGDVSLGAIQIGVNGLLMVQANSNTNFKGLESDTDFSSIDPENPLIYAQRSYVDRVFNKTKLKKIEVFEDFASNINNFLFQNNTSINLLTINNQISPIFSMADANNDGSFDIIVGNGTSTVNYPHPHLNNCNNYLYLNNGSGNYTLANISGFSIGRLFAFGSMGDFNNDGKVDFISGPADCCVGAPKAV